MLSPSRIQPKNTNKRTKKSLNTNSNNNSHSDSDAKRPQMTSSDLFRPNRRDKSILKAGSMQKNNEINNQYLDEILDNNDI